MSCLHIAGISSGWGRAVTENAVRRAASFSKRSASWSCWNRFQSCPWHAWTSSPCEASTGDRSAR